MFTLSGTPIIYYGDEFAKENDESYYQEIFALTGYQDSRYFVRGRIDWDLVERDLQDSDTLAYQVYHSLKAMIQVRKEHPAFSRGSLEFVHYPVAGGGINPCILAYYRVYETDRRLIIHNLSSEEQHVHINNILKKTTDLLDQQLIIHTEYYRLSPYSFSWL
jgi:maltose alpha-D-glucosyltransferase/alpha-amylase